MKNLIAFVALCGSLNSFAGSFVDSSQYYFSKGIEEKTAKRYLTASQNFEKAINFDKSNVQAYLENGYANMEMRKTDQAKVNFTKVYELQPSNTASIKELANLYFDYRQWDKAIEFAGKCKDCSNADRIIGMSNYEKEDYGVAEKALLRAVAKSPEDAKVQYTLARMYIDMELEKKAVPFFEKAVALNPEKSAWAYELALVYFNNNDNKNAVKSYEAAAANGYIQSNDFNENYGYALLYSGNYEKGEEKLWGVYQRKPGNKEIVRDIAQILYEQKQFNRSLDYCQRLLQMDMKDGKALYQAGLNFLKLGQKEKGQGMCDKAIEVDPSLASKRTKKMDLGGGNDIGAL